MNQVNPTYFQYYVTLAKFDSVLTTMGEAFFDRGLAWTRWLCRVVVILLLTGGQGLAKHYDLRPVVVLGPPIDSGITVIFEAPDTWVPRRKTEYPITNFKRVFVPTENSDDAHPAVSLSVEARVAGKADPSPSDLTDPKMSQTASNMEEFAPIDHIGKIESFNGGMERKFTIWGLHSKPRYGKAYMCYLVLLHYKHVGVEICLRVDDSEKVGTYLTDVKKVARSVRFDQK